MQTTPDRGYRYPTGSDATKIALYFANLASDVNDDVKKLVWSPWTALTLDSGFTTNSNYYPPAYRTKGNTVQFRGAVIRNVGNFASGATTFVTAVPSAINPAAWVQMVCAVGANSSFSTARLELVGTLKVWMPSAATNTIFLDGATYELV